MEENRKLAFSKEVTKREEERQRKFRKCFIFVSLIVYTIVSVLMSCRYKEIVKETSKYIYTAQDIYFKGIEGINYNELSVTILDNSVNFDDIYKKGIHDIGYDKLSVKIVLDKNLQILQKGNKIYIKRDIYGELIKLKFEDNSVNIVFQSQCMIFIALILMFACIDILIILLYEAGEEKRMIKDTKRIISHKTTEL